MKKYTQWLLCLLFLSILRIASAQSVSKELSPGYYVVVGAYASNREENARRFVVALNDKGQQADYGFNKSRNLYFVYLEYFNNLKSSLQRMQAVREQGKFVDAWVRVVPGDINFDKPVIVSKPQAEVIASEKKPEQIDVTAVTEGKEAPESIVKSDTKSDAAIKSDTAASDIEVTENDEIKQYPHMTLGNTEVFLSLYNARNNRIVDGDVQVIDTERSRQIMKVKGNEYLLLPDPKSKSGQLTLICESFGYRKIQHELNYPVPLADTVKPHIDLLGTTIVVNFDLVRYHKGDIITLYNVYFYNDAAIMQPESKYELNSLLELMNENPKYRIRLHGHTNGNYSGKIITMGPEKNFFTLTGTKESMGTATDLSRQRAEVIKSYLVDNGIDPLRIEIKAWGGRRPLYDKKNVNARKNVRVDVEMLDE